MSSAAKVIKFRFIDSLKYCNYRDSAGYCCTALLDPRDGSSQKFCKIHRKTLGGLVDDPFSFLYR